MNGDFSDNVVLIFLLFRIHKNERYRTFCKDKTVKCLTSFWHVWSKYRHNVQADLVLPLSQTDTHHLPFRFV